MLMVHVTDHVLERARQRCPALAGATADELIAVFRQARKIKRNEPFRLTRLPGTCYHHHEQRDLIFVVEPVSQKSVRLITVYPREVGTPAPPCIAPEPLPELPPAISGLTWNQVRAKLRTTKNHLQHVDKALASYPKIPRNAKSAEGRQKFLAERNALIQEQAQLRQHERQVRPF